MQAAAAAARGGGRPRQRQGAALPVLYRAVPPCSVAMTCKCTITLLCPYAIIPPSRHPATRPARLGSAAGQSVRLHRRHAADLHPRGRDDRHVLAAARLDTHQARAAAAGRASRQRLRATVPAANGGARRSAQGAEKDEAAGDAGDGDGQAQQAPPIWVVNRVRHEQRSRQAQLRTGSAQPSAESHCDDSSQRHWHAWAAQPRAHPHPRDPGAYACAHAWQHSLSSAMPPCMLVRKAPLPSAAQRRAMCLVVRGCCHF